MFKKLLTTTAVMTSIMASGHAIAQQSTRQTTKTTQAATTKALEDKKKAEADALKKAEEAKKKAAADAAKAEQEKKDAEALALANAPTHQKIWNYLKSTVTVSYHGEYLFRRPDIYSPNSADHGIKDFYWMHNPTIIYRPIENWRILATSEFKYFDSGVAGSYINRHYRSLFSITRENILTEDKNGVKMDIGVARRQFDKEFPGSAHGNWRLVTNFKKTFNPNFSTSLLAQYLYNDPKNAQKTAGNMWNHSVELIPSFSWQITEKLSWFFNDDIVINTPRNSGQAEKIDISHEMNIAFLSYQFNDKHSAYFQYKYLHFTKKSFQEAFRNKMDWFDYYIGHTYAITPKVSFTTEIGSTMFKGGDGKDFFAKNIKYPELYFYFDWRL